MPRPKLGADFVNSSIETQGEEIDRLARRWRYALSVVFVLLLGGLWSMVLQDAAHERRLTITAAAERDANLAIAVEHYVTRVLRTTRAVHSYLGQLVMQGRPDDELSGVLADRVGANDFLSGLVLCFPEGRLLSKTRTAGAHLLPALCASVRETALDPAEVTVLKPLGLTGGSLLPLASPIRMHGGQQVAVAIALVDRAALLGIMKSVVLRDTTWVNLSRADGTLLAAWSSEDSGSGLQPRIKPDETVAPSGGPIELGGRSFYVAARDMGVSNLRVHVASAESDVLEDFRARRWRTVVIALASSGTLAVMFILLWRLNARGLSHTRQLVVARAALAQANHTLDAKVQERTKQLESAYQDLETFTYTLAHDVRAPLASISGFAQALEPGVAASKDTRALHYLERIRANAQRMDVLTSQLLDLGRLANKPMSKETVDLSSMARELLEDLRMRDPSRQIEPKVADGLTACGDSALLRQVLENLLGNAWKFTSHQFPAVIEFLRVPAREHEDAFVIRDNGVGFDSNAAVELFQPFKRMHSQTEFPGTGVGLAAVQRICVKHGGRVWCDSQVGAGARFYFALPRRDQA